MKRSLKQFIYKVRPYRFPQNIDFKTGYIFHTEEVYNSAIFSRLIGFCRDYTAITGKQAICTVMSGVSPKVNAGMKAFDCSHEKLADLYHQLSKVATIGYHGHFYLNPALYQRYETEIRSNNCSVEQLTEQFNNDLEWFKKYELNHNGLYAGGWWFMNQHMISLLIQAGFKYDFSFSKHRYFLNQFSHHYMLEHNIRTGENFEIKIEGKGAIKEVQNLIGSVSSSFFNDYVRNLLKILDPTQKEVVGLFNSHDYDLHTQNALNLFKELAKLPNVSFFDAADLLAGNFETVYKPTFLPLKRFEKIKFNNPTPPEEL